MGGQYLSQRARSQTLGEVPPLTPGHCCHSQGQKRNLGSDPFASDESIMGVENKKKALEIPPRPYAGVGDRERRAGPCAGLS